MNPSHVVLAYEVSQLLMFSLVGGLVVSAYIIKTFTRKRVDADTPVIDRQVRR